MDEIKIKKVAVLGAGVMGAQIAAHFVNAGIPVILYDLPAPKGDPNSLIKSAIEGLLDLKPNPLSCPERRYAIHPGNYQHDLSQLASCDLIIEAISERLDWKKDLFCKIEPYIEPHTILATNTSGLSITELSKSLPLTLQSRFIGMHFFNPPRYMRLVELIPHARTNQKMIDCLEAFLVKRLGKGVIHAKDSPNFIGNRIGIFALLSVIYHAEKFDIPPDVVDLLTGPLIGRPKSATFRTLDIVGLDTMQYVINTLKSSVTEDPWVDYYQLPLWLNELIVKGYLGQKTKKGIYEKKDRHIRVIDRKEGAYRNSKPQIAPEIKALFDKPCSNWLMDLEALSHPQAQFLWHIHQDLFAYSAYHLNSIAHNVRDIDYAMRWGYGWKEGPFEMWQRAGWKAITNKINIKQIPLPVWINECLEGPYLNGKALAPSTGIFEPLSSLPVYKEHWYHDQLISSSQPRKQLIYESQDYELWLSEHDATVPILSFKTKQNTITDDVLDGIIECVQRAEKDYRGLVIWQGVHSSFSYGANLSNALEAMLKSDYQSIATTVSKFQKAAMCLRYSTVPVVAALNRFALGGGCELAMHCSQVVASHETYIGLVEVGVGLLPAGGGAKELAKRASLSLDQHSEMFISRIFDQIMKAQISSSALDAINKSYLNANDKIIMHPLEVIAQAVKQVRHLSTFYQAPLKLPFAIGGVEVKANLQIQLINLLEGHFITEHEFFIGNHVADVLTGGELPKETLVSEDWILALERERFMELVKTQATKERIAHLLETGKPLRN